MSRAIDQMVDSFVDVLRNDKKRGVYSFTRTATVSRKDSEGVWVKFNGSDNETPVRLGVDASVGDTVSVRVANGRAYVNGNMTVAEEGEKGTPHPEYKLGYGDSSSILTLLKDDEITSEVNIGLYSLSYDIDNETLNLLKDGVVVSSVIISAGDYDDGTFIEY